PSSQAAAPDPRRIPDPPARALLPTGSGVPRLRTVGPGVPQVRAPASGVPQVVTWWSGTPDRSARRDPRRATAPPVVPASVTRHRGGEGRRNGGGVACSGQLDEVEQVVGPEV